MYRRKKFRNLAARRIGKKGMRSTLVGIFVNLGLALTKCTAGFFGYSFALIADGLESAADVITGLVVYLGLRIALRPPDENHPYGHGKAEPIAALVVGLSLIVAAVAIALESIHGIITPHLPPAPYTLVVLAGVLIIKEFLFRHVSAVGESIGSTAVRSDAWHHRSDAITSAFAFVGVSVALVGGKGWEAADRWAALGAACVILYNALKQLRPAILELGDVAPDPSTETRIRRIAGQVPGVLGLDKCFVRKMGFNYYADLHIVVKGELSVREGHRIAHQVEDDVLRALPQVSEVLVHVEPEEELAAKQITADHY
jgi:cation diffusion facilitator family transporter